MVTPVSSRKTVNRSEVGTQTDPLMAAQQHSQSGIYRRVRKVVPKWQEENLGYYSERLFRDKDWKKVLERAKHDKLDLLELSAEGWRGLVKRLGVSLKNCLF